MDIIYIILLENRVRFNINLPVFFSRFFELLFPKSRIKDERQRKKKNRTKKPSNTYNRYKKQVGILWNNQCGKCKSKENLQIHHLVTVNNGNLKLHPDCGALLCGNHHRQFHEIYGYNGFTPKDFWEFIEQ